MSNAYIDYFLMPKMNSTSFPFGTPASCFHMEYTVSLFLHKETNLPYYPLMPHKYYLSFP